MSILLWVVVGQLVVGALVLAVLFYALNTMLCDMAVRYIELWHPDEDEDEPAVRSVQVVSRRSLKAAYQERIQKALRKNFPADIRMDFVHDPAVWGGVIVRMDRRVMDCSLNDRIRRAFGPEK